MAACAEPDASKAAIASVAPDAPPPRGALDRAAERSCDDPDILVIAGTSTLASGRISSG
jgi:hypothetical protein